MARDRTYEMGCNCDKRLLWCDGSCMDEKFFEENANKPNVSNLSNTSQPEDTFNRDARNINIKGVIVILIVAAIYFSCC